MATFDVSNHALLSADAADLDAVTFAAHNAAAEIVLGLADVDVAELVASKVTMAELAVVFQINYQVAMADEGFFLQSVTKGPLTLKFRNEHINPQAAPLATQVLASLPSSGTSFDPDDWATITSLR